MSETGRPGLDRAQVTEDGVGLEMFLFPGLCRDEYLPTFADAAGAGAFYREAVTFRSPGSRSAPWVTE